MSFRLHHWFLGRRLLLGLGSSLIGLIAWWMSEQVVLAVVFVIFGIALVIPRYIIWREFELNISNRRLVIHAFQKLDVNNRLIPLTGLNVIELRQGPIGYLFDYGDVLVTLPSGEISLSFITPFNELKRQLLQP